MKFLKLMRLKYKDLHIIFITSIGQLKLPTTADS